jgi:hypothetical protein
LFTIIVITIHPYAAAAAAITLPFLLVTAAAGVAVDVYVGVVCFAAAATVERSHLVSGFLLQSGGSLLSRPKRFI